MDEEMTESFWVRMKERAGISNVVAGVWHKLPDQEDQEDKEDEDISNPGGSWNMLSITSSPSDRGANEAMCYAGPCSCPWGGAGGKYMVLDSNYRTLELRIKGSEEGTLQAHYPEFL